MFLLRRILQAVLGEEENGASIFLPLKRVALQCEVRDNYATVEVTQTFINTGLETIECEYVFPVLEDAVLSKMTVHTSNGRLLVAQVEELQQAKEIYSDSISQGSQTVLGRLESEKRLVLNIGNLPSKATVEVTFRFVQVIGCIGEKWLFQVPGTLFPTFPWEMSGDDTDEPTSLVFMRPEGCGYRMHFSLRIKACSAICDISCKSHSLNVVRLESPNEALLASEPSLGFLPGRDIEVTFETVSCMQPHLSLQLNPSTEEYAGMLSFLPPLLSPGESSEELTGYGEFIYILDRSGSMAGSRINLAKQAALLFIKSLPATSVFNIVSFGSDIDSLFPLSQPYTAESVSYALMKLNDYAADLGGTNILLPLDHIFRRPGDPQYPRSLFLLTDGEVQNPEAVIGFVEAHSKDARFTPFGIGNEVSVAFLQEIAAAGNGSATFISDLNEIKTKVINALQGCIAPGLTNIKVQWPMRGVRQFPSNERVTTCHFGEVFTVMALFGKQRPVPGSTVTITANSSKNGDKLMLEVPVDDSVATDRDLYQLWGKFALKELFFLERQLRDADLKQEIIALSKQCNVPCIYTALVCTEEQVDSVSGPVHLRKVPVACTADRRLRGRMMAMATPNYRLPVSSRISSERHYAAHSGSCCGGGEYREPPQQMHVNAPAHFSIPRTEARNADFIQSSLLLRLLSLQTVAGNWELSSLPSEMSSMKSTPEDIARRYGGDADAIWATLCALEFLAEKFAASEGEWRLIARKGRIWLKAHAVTSEEFASRIRQLLA